MTSRLQGPKFSTWCGSLRMQQDHFEVRTTMDVRRVMRDDIGEHVQIAVTVEKSTAKRVLSQHGSIDLRPEDVQLLINALTKLHQPHSGCSLCDAGCEPTNEGKHATAEGWVDCTKSEHTMNPWSQTEREDREFYGLPSEETGR